MTSAPNRVAILDAGGQYIDLVRKAVERQGIPADVLPLAIPANKLEGKYGAIIISGSPASSHAETAPQPDPSLWQSSLPLLGICYGMQSMMVAAGGQVAKNAIREDGRVTTKVDVTQPIFDGIKPELTALFTHGDFVKSVPDEFKVIGEHTLSDGSTAYSAVRSFNKYGVQFHPEVFDDTPEGYQIFKNFLYKVAGLKEDEDFRNRQLEELIKNKQALIKEQAANRHVIAFVSGGIDSSVAATLAARVIPSSHLHAFYIDSGFMRDEDELVIVALASAGLNVTKVDAVKDFEQGEVKLDGKTYGPLVKVNDPEIKRKIIGKVFVEIQNRLIKDLGLNEALLLQGTNAADRIESGHSQGDSHTMTIKTHHNQVAEVQTLKTSGLLIEPLDDLFKDEVREVGRELGLPEELVQRQPFPGPGLAIRIMATDESKDKLEPLLGEEPIQNYLDKEFKLSLKAHLLPVKSVGVGGDERSHLSVLAIDHAKLLPEELSDLGRELPAHFRDQVNRVIFALIDKPLHPRSLTKTLLNKEARDQLKHADRIVFEEMREQDLLNKISQFPVILLPLSFGEKGGRSIVLRPVKTSTFMTLQAMLPGEELPKGFLENTAKRIKAEVPGITQVLLDLTNKPPGTTEWE